MKLPRLDTLTKKLVPVVIFIAALSTIAYNWNAIFPPAPPPHFNDDQIHDAESNMARQGWTFTQHLQFVGANPDGSGLYRAYTTMNGTSYIWDVKVYKDQSSADKGFSNEIQDLQTHGYKGDYIPASESVGGKPEWKGQRVNGITCYVLKEFFEGCYVVDVTHTD